MCSTPLRAAAHALFFAGGSVGGRRAFTTRDDDDSGGSSSDGGRTHGLARVETEPRLGGFFRRRTVPSARACRSAAEGTTARPMDCRLGVAGGRDPTHGRPARHHSAAAAAAAVNLPGRHRRPTRRRRPLFISGVPSRRPPEDGIPELSCRPRENIL